MATEKQISYLASLCNKGEWAVPSIEGLDTKVVSRMIDCAKRGFDPARIDTTTGDETLSVAGYFMAVHKPRLRVAHDIHVIDTRSGEVVWEGQNFTYAHQQVQQRDAADKAGVPFKFKDTAMVHIGGARGFVK